MDRLCAAILVTITIVGAIVAGGSAILPHIFLRH